MKELKDFLVLCLVSFFLLIFFQVFLDIRNIYSNREDLKIIMDNAAELEMNRFQSVDLSTSLEEKNKYINKSGLLSSNYTYYLNKLQASPFINNEILEYLSTPANVAKGMLPIDLGLPYLDLDIIEPLIEQDIITLSEYNKNFMASGIEITEAIVEPIEDGIFIAPINQKDKDVYWGSNAISYQTNDLYGQDFIITFRFKVKCSYTYSFRTSLIYGLEIPLEQESEYQYTLVY